jgi:hypothetical protein
MKLIDVDGIKVNYREVDVIIDKLKTETRFIRPFPLHSK